MIFYPFIKTLTKFSFLFSLDDRDELRNDDVSLRLNSVRRLTTIAMALGEERTRDELIPFLLENHDDEDEVLLVIAEELGKFVPLVGGPQFAHTLLPPLEALSAVDETVVRDKVVHSLSKVGENLSGKEIEKHFIPMLERLMSKEWTARVSASHLFVVAYPTASKSSRERLRQWFAQLSKDETPMVRRAAAGALAKFIPSIEQNFVLKELLPIFEGLKQDEQDSVRLISVEACGPLAEAMKNEDHVKEHVLPVLLTFISDQSWRVRYNATTQVPTLASALGKATAASTLLLPYVGLLRDGEAEVRAAAASKIADMAKYVPASVYVKDVLPVIDEIAGDPSQYVRTSLANSITELAPLLGKEVTSEHLLKAYLELLGDECPEVRLGIISKLDDVGQIIGVDLLTQSLLPAIEKLAEDGNWRVRLAIIEHVPLLAEQLGPEFLQQKLGPQCMIWLKDQVFTIREAAIGALKRLTEQFGSDWAKEHVLTDVMSALESENYLHRITSMHALSELTPHLRRDIINSQIVPSIIKATNDPVPNVRFNAAKSLGTLCGFVDSGILEKEMKPCLETLTTDSDVDVRFFATKALAECDTTVSMK